MLETVAQDFGIPEEALSNIKDSNDGSLAKAYLLCFLSGFQWSEIPYEGNPDKEESSLASIVTSWYTKKLADSLFETEPLLVELKSVINEMKKAKYHHAAEEPRRFAFRKGGKAAIDPVVRQQTYDIILADYLNNPKFSNEAKQLIFEGWEADDPLSTIRNYAQPEFDVDFMKKVREALLKRSK